ncbi:MAG: type II secretion system protein GspG [Kiritimatiellae bacterium]|nr:type II secretion system protein GspG [Kiritimatiellia bacterium]MDD5523445.1 type II secretion system protein GspG [Kiritimatiellia bacterium]
MKWIYILTVVSILVIGIMSLRIFSLSKGYHRDPDIAKLERIAFALHEYKAHSNCYPPSLEVLLSLPDAKPFFTHSNGDPLQDSWGNRFIYELKGSNYTLLSPGPDRIRGTGDDIQRKSE